MYKTIFTYLFVLISINSFSQASEFPKFTFEPFDFPTAVIVSAENNTKAELQDKTKTWIGNHFNKSSLINSKHKENSFIIEAKAERFLKIKNLPSDLVYQLKISIRDNKYRFEVTSISYKYYTELRAIAKISLIKDEVIKKDLDNSRSLLASYFNDLNLSLYSSIKTSVSDW